MPKPVDTAFKAYCEVKRNSEFAHDTFVDARTFLQDKAIRDIYKSHDVVDVVETTFGNSALYYYLLLRCKRLVCFKIFTNGLFVFHTVPVFGGNNTPYKKVQVSTKIKQLSCV